MPVYIAEIAPQNMRGSLGSVNQVGYVTLFVVLSFYVKHMFIEQIFFFPIVAFCNNWDYAGLLARTFCQLEIACCSR